MIGLFPRETFAVVGGVKAISEANVFEVVDTLDANWVGATVGDGGEKKEAEEACADKDDADEFEEGEGADLSCAWAIYAHERMIAGVMPGAPGAMWMAGSLEVSLKAADVGFLIDARFGDL